MIMYTIDDLFDKRSIFAAKLEQIMVEKAYTKSRLCKEAQISRPTLDKVLSSTITNEATFIKHAGKIMGCLKITPDVILGSVSYPYNNYKTLKNILDITDEGISENTGIPISRLQVIESGENATLAELRDIALCCRTSVRCVTGNYYFDQPLSRPSSFDSEDESSGFWGHVGILTSAKREYTWYPITNKVRMHILRSSENDYIVIPCMNNKLLLLNMSGVDNIVLLDEACDEPCYANWDENVSEGEVPLVIYEILTSGDYYEFDQKEERLSKQLRLILNEFLEKHNWDEEQIQFITDGISIQYKNGNVLEVCADWQNVDSVVEIVTHCYEIGRLNAGTKRLLIEEMDMAEIIVNMENVSMIEMPLVAVEKCICDAYFESDDGEGVDRRRERRL